MPTYSYKGHDFDVDHEPTEAEFTQMSAYVDSLPPKEIDVDSKLLSLGKKGLSTVTGGALGIGDFVYGGLKAIPQAIMAAGGVLGGNKASDVEKYMMPELSSNIEEIAPSLGTIAEKFGVPKEFATGSAGYKTMHDKPMEAIGELLQLPGKGVKALGGGEDLASGANIATMAGLVAAPLAKGAVPKAPINPLTQKIGLPFNKQEVPLNFKEARPLTNKAVEDLIKEDQKAQESKPEYSIGDPYSEKALKTVDKQMETRQRGTVAPQYDLNRVGVLDEGTFSKSGNILDPELSRKISEETGAPFTRDLKAEEYTKQNQVEQTFAERDASTPKLTEDIWNQFDETRAERAIPLEPTQGSINRGTFGQSGAINPEVLKEGMAAFAHRMADITGDRTTIKKVMEMGVVSPEQRVSMINEAVSGRKLGGTGKSGFGQGGVINLGTFLPSKLFKEPDQVQHQYGARTFKNPIHLKDGSRISGINNREASTVYGYDKNGELFSMRVADITPDMVVSSKDSNKTSMWFKERVGVGKTTSMLGGPGKKQGGAIGWKSKVTPEEIMQQYKEATGQELDVARAIKKANEVNDSFDVIKQKVVNVPVNEKLAKILKSPFTAKEILTPDEAKLALDEGIVKDVDTNFIKRTINSVNRGTGSTYGIRAYYNHPILEALMRPLSRAADSAKYTADHVNWGKEGVGTLLSKLSENEMNILWERMQRGVGKADMTPEQMFADLNPSQVAAGKALKKAYEQDLKLKNEARAVEGKKPLTPEANHLASSWSGDRIAIVYDAEGKTKAVLTGYKADIEVGKRWISENHPDWIISKDTFRGSTSLKGKDGRRLERSNQDNLAELYDDLLAASEKGEISLQEAVIREMNKARVLASERVKGVNVHEKFKNKEPVLGAQGYKPWKTATENAQEGFQAQVSHLENSITRTELSKAAKHIQEYKEKLGNIRAVQYAESKLRDMQGIGTWEFVKVAEDSIRDRFTQSDVGSTLLKGYRGFEHGTSVAMNIKYFALDPIFAAINTLEVVTKTPVAIVHGLKESVAPWAAKKTIEHMVELNRDPTYLERLTGDAKFAHDYAMAQNVGNPTVEGLSSVKPKTVGNQLIGMGKGVLEKSMLIPEKVSRYTAFTTTFHTLRAAGLELQHAADLSHDLVKLYFKDYSPLEAAAIFQKTGTIGMQGGRQLRTWVLGEINLMSSALMNKQPGILTAAIALSALMYGADSVPLFKQFDETLAWIREMAIRQSNDPATIKELSELVTPREFLYSPSGLSGDPRGLLDRGLDQIGVEGYTVGRTEWRVLPEGLIEILLKAKFLMDGGVSVAAAVKEATRDDPDAGLIVKNLLDPVAPKIAVRGFEMKNQMTKDGTILNDKNNFSPNKTLHTEAEKRAYMLGSQPKTSYLQKYGEQLDIRKTKEIQERETIARDKLVAAYNNLAINPNATARYDEAVKDFVRQYGGKNKSSESIKTTLRQAAIEMKWSPEQIKKIETIKNAKNNMELVKFFKEVTGKPEKR